MSRYGTLNMQILHEEETKNKSPIIKKINP